MKEERLEARVEPYLKRAVQLLAEQNNTTPSQEVRLALMEKLDHYPQLMKKAKEGESHGKNNMGH